MRAGNRIARGDVPKIVTMLLYNGNRKMDFRKGVTPCPTHSKTGLS
jgi:hypothetical protein